MSDSVLTSGAGGAQCSVDGAWPRALKSGACGAWPQPGALDHVPGGEKAVGRPAVAEPPPPRAPRALPRLRLFALDFGACISCRSWACSCVPGVGGSSAQAILSRTQAPPGFRGLGVEGRCQGAASCTLNLCRAKGLQVA